MLESIRGRLLRLVCHLWASSGPALFSLGPRRRRAKPPHEAKTKRGPADPDQRQEFHRLSQQVEAISQASKQGLEGRPGPRGRTSPIISAISTSWKMTRGPSCWTSSTRTPPDGRERHCTREYPSRSLGCRARSNPSWISSAGWRTGGILAKFNTLVVFESQHWHLAQGEAGADVLNAAMGIESARAQTNEKTIPLDRGLRRSCGDFHAGAPKSVSTSLTGPETLMTAEHFRWRDHLDGIAGGSERPIPLHRFCRRRPARSSGDPAQSVATRLCIAGARNDKELLAAIAATLKLNGFFYSSVENRRLIFRSKASQSRLAHDNYLSKGPNTLWWNRCLRRSHQLYPCVSTARNTHGPISHKDLHHEYTHPFAVAAAALMPDCFRSSSHRPNPRWRLGSLQKPILSRCRPLACHILSRRGTDPRHGSGRGIAGAVIGAKTLTAGFSG